MIQWGSRARPPRLQSGQAPLSRALPRTGPRSCLAARVRREVDTVPTCSSFLLGVSPERPSCPLLLTQLRRPLCAIKIHLGCSLSNPPEHSDSFTKFSAVDCAPERKLYPSTTPHRAVFLSNSGRNAAASTSPWPASPRASPPLLLAPLGSR